MNNLYVYGQSVLFNTDADISGFQFTVNGDLDGASGVAGELGYSISTTLSGLVLGFSFSGAIIRWMWNIS